MTRFAAPIAEQIWDMKYRLKDADGTPLDTTVEDSWRRVARDLASVEADPALPDLSALTQADIDLDQLDDLEGTLELLTDLGIL